MRGSERGRRSRRSGGVTLPEVLVVLAIVALAVTLAIPVISETVRSARVRSAANSFAVSLKAARMLAVTSRRPVAVRVYDFSGQNAYEYEGRRGQTLTFGVPAGVRIATSTSPIVFQPNGGVAAGASTTFEVDLGRGSTEVWRIDTSNLGLSTVVRVTAPPES